jgi:hypothetical protein
LRVTPSEGSRRIGTWIAEIWTGDDSEAKARPFGGYI